MAILREWRGPAGGDVVEVACDGCGKVATKRGTHAARARGRDRHRCKSCNQRENHYEHTPEIRARLSKAVREAMTSPEVRQRISENQPDQSGERNAFYGRRHSETTRAKLRANNPFKGTCNPWWHPWMSETRKGWSDAVRRMFRNSCAVCNAHVNELKSRGLKLDAHHVVPACARPDLRYDLNNGVALCRVHHTNAHRMLRSDPVQYEATMRALQAKRAVQATPLTGYHETCPPLTSGSPEKD